MKIFRRITFLLAFVTIASASTSNAIGQGNTQSACSVVIQHINNNTVVNTEDPNSFYYYKDTNDKIRVAFEFTSSDIFGQENFLNNLANSRKLWINQHLNTFKSDSFCYSYPISVEEKRVIFEFPYGGSCLAPVSSAGIQQETGNVIFALRYTDNGGNNQTLCQKSVAIIDKDQQELDEALRDLKNRVKANIAVEPVDGKGDVNSEWLVIIKDLQIPSEVKNAIGIGVKVLLDGVDLMDSYKCDALLTGSLSVRNCASYISAPGSFANTTIRPSEGTLLMDPNRFLSESIKQPTFFSFTLKPFSLPGTHTIGLVITVNRVEVIVEKNFIVRSVANASCQAEIDQKKPLDQVCSKPQCLSLFECASYRNDPPSETESAIDPDIKNVCKNLENQKDCEDCMTGIKFEGQPGAYTALGCIPTDLPTFLSEYLFTIGLGFAGGIAFLLMLWGGFNILISQGDAHKIQMGREIIVSAGVGLIFIIFAIVILQIIGKDIIGIPGFE